MNSNIWKIEWHKFIWKINDISRIQIRKNIEIF